MITKDILQIAKNLGGVFRQNSPTILTSLAVGGLITSIALAIRATPKALSLIDEGLYSRYEASEHGSLLFWDWLKQETSKEGIDWNDRLKMLSRRDILRTTWRCYVPTSAVAIASIACIIGANQVLLRRNAAIASLYTITEKAFGDYKSKVMETFGDKKELRLRDDIDADRIKANPPSSNEIIFTGKGKVKCYDSWNGRYFESDIEKIRRSVNDLNEELLTNAFVTLNDFYYALGLSGTDSGNLMGWNLDTGKLKIDYGSHLTDDGEPCLVLNYQVVPRYI